MLRASLKRVVNITNKRQFWSLGEGSCVGYVEGITNAGVLFKNRNVLFRTTSSNISNGHVGIASIEFLNTDQRNLLESAMVNRLNVKLHNRAELLGAPWNGDIGCPVYVTSVEFIKPTPDAIIKT